jgi:hypothetical protein
MGSATKRILSCLAIIRGPTRPQIILWVEPLCPQLQVAVGFQKPKDFLYGCNDSLPVTAERLNELLEGRRN